MIYVISDLHGYPHSDFIKLLEKAGFSDNDFLYILGDVIDRNGDGGVETLNWLLYQPNAQLIMGNHEAMLLGCSFMFEEIKEESVKNFTAEKLEIAKTYMANGGSVTLETMKALDKEEQQDILDYLRDCPLYEIVSTDDKDFLLVHSGLGNFYPGKKIKEYTAHDFLWCWPEITDEYYENVMTVFGHTPTMSFGEEYKGKVIYTKTWIDIDVGAGFGMEPVLLRLDDMKEFRLSD